jgi:pseudouridine-5'-phosphate glycosidase
MNKFVDISEEVKVAITKGLPIVALESTIISHGMPYPQNVETALTVERIIIDKGAVPATIAIIKGRLKVGLTHDEIDYMGKTKDMAKVSRRDIPYIISKKMDGATTVSSTMIIAALAGIRVFATGGIGGVHRGAERTMDISADLEELAHTNVAVVCAGAKAILDLGLTLEYLETKGVPVLGYNTDTLPAFYTMQSDFKVDYNMKSAEEIASLIYSKWTMGLDGGVLVTNPIPEEFSMERTFIDGAISEAVAEAKVLGIKGKAATPYLLAKIAAITEGRSLDSNIQLVYNNAKLASDIAIELNKM